MHTLCWSSSIVRIWCNIDITSIHIVRNACLAVVVWHDSTWLCYWNWREERYILWAVSMYLIVCLVDNDARKSLVHDSHTELVCLVRQLLPVQGFTWTDLLALHTIHTDHCSDCSCFTHSLTRPMMSHHYTQCTTVWHISCILHWPCWFSIVLADAERQ